MTPNERAIGRDLGETKVSIIRYEVDGETYHDLFTDGRVLLSQQLALKIAKALTEYAEGCKV